MYLKAKTLLSLEAYTDPDVSATFLKKYRVRVQAHVEKFNARRATIAANEDEEPVFYDEVDRIIGDDLDVDEFGYIGTDEGKCMIVDKEKFMKAFLKQQNMTAKQGEAAEAAVAVLDYDDEGEDLSEEFFGQEGKEGAQEWGTEDPELDMIVYLDEDAEVMGDDETPQ